MGYPTRRFITEPERQQILDRWLMVVYPRTSPAQLRPCAYETDRLLYWVSSSLFAVYHLGGCFRALTGPSK